MKQFISSLVILCLIYSCSDDELTEPVQSTSNSYDYSYKTEGISLYNILSNNGMRISFDANDIVFKLEFKTNLSIPHNVRNSGNLNAVETYLRDNIDSVDGELLFYENAKLIRTKMIQDGISYETRCANPHDGHCDDNYPLQNECSYSGIQDCVQHSIYEEMNTLEQIICAFEGFACIEMEAVSCVFENCF